MSQALAEMRADLERERERERQRIHDAKYGSLVGRTIASVDIRGREHGPKDNTASLTFTDGASLSIEIEMGYEAGDEELAVVLEES